MVKKDEAIEVEGTVTEALANTMIGRVEPEVVIHDARVYHDAGCHGCAVWNDM